MTRYGLALIVIMSGIHLAERQPAWAQESVFEAGSSPAASEAPVEEAANPVCPVLVNDEGIPIPDGNGFRQFDPTPATLLDDGGDPILDEAGNVATEPCSIPPSPPCPPILDDEGQPQLDDTGAPLFDETPSPVMNEAGDPILTETGDPLLEACSIPTEALSADQVAAEPETNEPDGPLSPLRRLLEAGGPIIVILSFLAVLVVAVGLVKLVQFLWVGVGGRRFMTDALAQLRSGKPEAAIADLDHRRNPVARVMASAIRGKTNKQMDDTVVREEVTRVAQAQLDGLERGLVVLSLIATIAPLLGLLGTVLGMIEAFQQMETVGDRVEPAVLAGGIWEALLTTAAGLSVAIPAAILFTWLQRSVDVEGQHMEDAATQVFTVPLYKAANEA